MATVITYLYALMINFFGNMYFYLFTEDVFKKLRWSSCIVLVDFMPKVIAMGVMIATVMKKKQSPASTYGRWRSLFSAIFNLSSFVSLLLGLFVLIANFSLNQSNQLSLTGPPKTFGFTFAFNRFWYLLNLFLSKKWSTFLDSLVIHLVIRLV